jgi:hypothetical protein
MKNFKQYQSLNEAAMLIVEETKNPHIKVAKEFLKSADDDSSADPIKRKHVLAAASAIAKHHSDWDAKKAGDMGMQHFVHSTCHADGDSPGACMAQASKHLKIHPELHNALVNHMHDAYGKEEVERKYKNG